MLLVKMVAPWRWYWCREKKGMAHVWIGPFATRGDAIEHAEKSEPKRPANGEPCVTVNAERG